MTRRLTGALLGAGAITAALVAVGTGPLATPPLLHPGAMGPWEARLGPLDAVFALLRVGALVAGGYVDAVLLLGAVAAVAGAPRGRRLALRLAPPPLRVLLVVAVAVSAAPVTAWASPAVAPPPAGAAPPASMLDPVDVPPAAAPAPVLHALGLTRRPAHRAEPASAPVLRPTPRRLPQAPVLRSAPPAHVAPAPAVPSTSTAPAPARRVEPRPAVRPRPTRAPGAGPALLVRSPRSDTWTVAPGESFWSIAADVVAGRVGHRPSDEEVARYWVALVRANAGRLPVPGDPDLLFAGDVLVLPAS